MPRSTPFSLNTETTVSGIGVPTDWREISTIPSGMMISVSVPYDNYRGTVIDAHGRTWLALDTGIKVAGFTKNTPGDAIKTLNLSTIRESYLTGFKPETPLEYLTAQLNDQLAENSADATYDDLLLKRTINQEHMQIIPASLQFTEIAVTGEQKRGDALK